MSAVVSNHAIARLWDVSIYVQFFKLITILHEIFFLPEYNISEGGMIKWESATRNNGNKVDELLLAVVYNDNYRRLLLLLLISLAKNKIEVE